MLTTQAASRTSSTVSRGFEDGLGRRYRPATRNDSDAPLEILCFRHEITDVPSFNFALRERVARLVPFRHPYYTRILKVDRLNDDRGTVALMSDGAPGVRLSEILTDVERSGQVLDLDAALYLVRQLISAVAVLHEQARVAHGAIAPERLFLTPRGRLCLVEYVLGAALEQLKYSRERYWKDLRLALPMTVGLPRFDERADLTQLGVVALALILGRQLQEDEYPDRVDDLISAARAYAPDGSNEPLPQRVRDWLRRAIQLDPRTSFRSVLDAQEAFDEILSEDARKSTNAESLEAFLARYQAPKPEAAPIKPTLVAEGGASWQAAAEPPLLEPEPAPPAPAATAEAAPAAFDEEPEFTSPQTDDEEQVPMTSKRSGSRDLGRYKWIGIAAAAVLATTVGLFAARGRFASPAPAVTTGTVSVTTNPPGALVEVDGTSRGQTPISLSLAAGEHTLVVRGSGEPRTIPLSVTAGAQLSQYIELPIANAIIGQLAVRTEPAGATLTVDGVVRGKTPITLLDLTPGEHSVTLESELGSVTQKVTIEAGVPASLVVPMGAAAAAAPGWVAVSSPIVLELYEKGRLLGNSGIERIMLPSGRHEIELVNEAVAFRETRTVQVAANRTSNIAITLPKGSVSINALPWANVTIDGENIGDTPIGNHPITIGPHEVVFRNPQLGEQRRVITVTQQSPVRLSVDLTRK